MATDPVCGMMVDEQTAAGSAEYAGERYYFCSTHCLHKFQAVPQNYTRPAATPTVPSAVYTCPMHPEIRQKTPGACPKCGMALEPLVPPASPAPAASATEYVCPMHPKSYAASRELPDLRHGAGTPHRQPWGRRRIPNSST